MPPKGWKIKRDGSSSIKNVKNEFEPPEILEKIPRATAADWKKRKWHWRNQMGIMGDELQYLAVVRWLLEYPTEPVEYMEEDLGVTYYKIQKYWDDPKFREIMEAEIERTYQNEVRPRAMAHIMNSIKEGRMSVILKVADMAGWYDVIAKDKKGKKGGADGGGSGKDGAGSALNKMSKEEIKELLGGQTDILKAIGVMERQMKELEDRKRIAASEGRELEPDELAEIQAKEMELQTMVDGIMNEAKGERENLSEDEIGDEGDTE